MVYKFYEGAIEYKEKISRIMFIAKCSEDEALKRVSTLNTGEPNIETARFLYRFLLLGKMHKRRKK